jgi:hypothetical protein
MEGVEIDHESLQIPSLFTQRREKRMRPVPNVVLDTTWWGSESSDEKEDNFSWVLLAS